MRLSVDHRTVYRFSEPQERLVQMLRVSPENSHDQTVASWRIDVDCDARMKVGRDGFGNAITMLYVEGPIAHIAITVSGEVLTSHSDGVLHGVAETLPPALFLRATPCTAADAAIATFAADTTAGERDRLARLHAVSAALHGRFARDRGRGDPSIDAATAFAAATATPRDMAQMFAVAARSLGAPARYVSGYCLTGFDGAHRPTPHGWAEAHVDGLGWVGFDPWFGLCPQEDYVRVAVALDAAGAAPVAGSRLGRGDEELDVDVVVSREE
ncbi:MULTISPECIES: transglutaminase family protein [unclassified Sphingomonas]|uniref:transglutaminase family protein n=1 Tax=unclassified Sphingomonas TaxID=196159 RepID=UPI001F5A8272|nr:MULTISPECIES: transglutaminase family protein [unclassified Sphingomonas]